MKLLSKLFYFGSAIIVGLLLAMIVLFSSGCTGTYAHYKDVTFMRAQWGTKVKLDGLTAQSVSTNGTTNSLILKGYENEGKVNMELPYGIKISPSDSK